MADFLKYLQESGYHGVIFITIALFALVISFERIKVLYFKYNLNAELFMEKIKGYIMADKIEEAINYAQSHAHHPVGHITKSVLSRANRDDEAIQQSLDISMSESIPNVVKRLGYLSMVANVATLFGLLGTVHGLIMSFKAVSFADPSQKQTLLAQGIALAMNNTAMGLSIALPAIVLYGFLHARQAAILEQVNLSASKLVDVLSTRNYKGFDADNVFPNDLKSEKLNVEAPMPPKKRIG